MTRSKFLVNQEKVNCCESGGPDTKMGVHDVEDLLNFGVNPYLEKKIVLYRRNQQECFGIDVGDDCKIQTVHDSTAAQFDGQLRRGDKILAVNGVRVPTIGLLRKAISKTTSDTLLLRVLRSTNSDALNDARQTPRGMMQTDPVLTKVDVVLYRPEGQKGFGMTLEGNEGTGIGCSVNKVKPDTAASNSVKEGDIVSAVNGEQIEHLPLEAIVAKIQATKEDPLRLTLSRSQVSEAEVSEDVDMSEADEGDEDAYSPHSACPYYISKALSKHADIIFAPYNYILDPGIRSALDISLEGSVVVLDEGHNVFASLVESGSGQVRCWSVGYKCRDVPSAQTVQYCSSEKLSYQIWWLCSPLKPAQPESNHLFQSTAMIQT